MNDLGSCFTRCVCRPWVAAGIFLLVSTAPPAQAKPPNILIILADDLGYSDLGCYGGEIPTPRLDQLAAGGLRLTRLYTTGRCCPSRASLLTGHYSHRVGLGHMVKDLGQPGYRGALASSARTIAEVLQPAGYRSFIAGKWHLGTPDPTQHGFEQFYGTLISAGTFWDSDHFLTRPEGAPRRQYAPGTFYGTDAVTDHALDFIQQARGSSDRPWFLYLAYNAPHFPLHAPREDVVKHLPTYAIGWDRIRADRLKRMHELGVVPPGTPLSPRSTYTNWLETVQAENPAWESLDADRQLDLVHRMAIYAAMIDRMDQNIGRIVDDLKQAGELENTFICFLSDNGACFEWDPIGFDGKSGPDNKLHQGEELTRMGGPGTYHSVGSGWANASNTPWRLYKHYMHEGGISTPCILHWAEGLKRSGEINHEPAHIIDLLPTCLALAGLTPPADLGLPGVSLVPLMSGQALEPRSLFFEHQRNRAVIEGRWKLVQRRELRRWELYDLDSDRSELNDLASHRPDLVLRLSDLWQNWAKSNHVLPEPKDYQVGYLNPEE